MGGKPSNAMQRNRPETGGADKDERFETGIPERTKQEYASAMNDVTEQSREDQRKERGGNTVQGDHPSERTE